MILSPFAVLVSVQAERVLGALPAHERHRVHAAFDRLAQDPFRPRSGCDIRTIAGHPGVRAVRVGRFRILYSVDGANVLVTSVAHRSVAYRG